jgi:hypothetical protein
MSDTQGGSGGRNARRRRENRLTERALRERWVIPASLRVSLIRRLSNIVDDLKSGPRETISAAKAILSASKINLDDIAMTIKAREHEDLDRRMTELEREVEARKQINGAAGYPEPAKLIDSPITSG